MKHLNVSFCWFWLLLCFQAIGFGAFAQNQVLDLKNDRAYLDLGTGDLLKPADEVSYFFWAYHDNWQQITNKPTLLGNTQHVGYGIGLTIDQVQVWISIDSVYQNVDFPLALLRSGWHHFGVIFSGKEILLLLDGELVDLNVLPQESILMQPDSTISMMIGAETRYNRMPHPELFFHGKMDEIRIYHKALSTAAARAIYEGAVADVANENLMLYLPFEGTFDDQSIYSVPVEAFNQPETGLKELPSRWLAAHQPLLTYATLFIAVLVFLWLGITFRMQRSIWIMGVWAVQVFSFLLSDPFLFSWYSLGVPPGIWTDRIQDFLLLGSLLVFLKTLFTTYEKHVSPIIWVSVGIGMMLLLVLPVQLRAWLMVCGTVIAAGAIAWIALWKQQVLLFSLVLALLISAVLLVLELANVLDLYAFTPLNNPLSFAFFAVGFYPVIHHEKQQVAPEQVQDLKPALADLLTPKEAEVCRLLIGGKTDAEIAGILQLSTNTVKTYNKRIYTKVGVSGRLELLIFAKD